MPETYELINKNQKNQENLEDCWAQGLMPDIEFSGRMLFLQMEFEVLMQDYINA